MPVRPSLNVSLTPELAAYVGGRVASGRYRSASEVVRAALRLLQREEPGDGAAPARADHLEEDGTPGEVNPRG